MTTRNAINDFLSCRTLAVVGVSRSGKKFGNVVYKSLKAKGYRVFPINPHADAVEGDRCYPSVSALPEKVDGVVLIVPPRETERIVQEIAAERIPHVWMQQGSESEGTIRYCQEHGINVVFKECVLMFAEPVKTFHWAHLWARKLVGRLPQ